MADRFKYQGTFQDQAGNLVLDGTVSVFLAGTNTPANIFEAEAGGVAVNSITSDSVTGAFAFWVGLGVLDDGYIGNQDFKLVLSKTNYTPRTVDNVKIYHRQVLDFHTFEGSDTTPDVSIGNNFKTADTTLTISDFDNGYEGQRIYIIFKGSDTTLAFSGANLVGNAGVDKQFDINDVVVAIYDMSTGFWHCGLHEV